MFAIKDVIKLLTRIFAKQNKRFPKGLEAVDIRIKAKKIHDIGKAENYKGAISEDQLKQFLAFEKQQLERVPTRVIPAESAEGKIITDKITGKNVIPFPKERITDWTKPRPTEVTKPTFTATEHVEFIKSKEPIEAMKEANSLIGRKNPSYKGRYKNITDDEAKQILKDTEDHIFQRDVVPDEFDPDYASGGRIGAEGGGIAGMLGEPTYREPMLWGGTPRIRKAIKYIRDALRKSGIEKSRTGKTFPTFTEREKSLAKLTGIGEPPRSSSALAESIVEKLKMDLKHSKRREKITEGIASSIEKQPWLAGEKHSKDYIDYFKKSFTQMFDESKTIKDIEKNMGIMEIIQRNLSGRKLNAQGGRIGFKTGGFDPGKRNFLKILGGLAALPVVGKFFKWAKPLRSVQAPLTHAANIKAGTQGMPVWFPKLVNRVVDEGTDVTKKLGTKEREIVHHAKVNEFEDVTVYRELDTGNVRVEYGPPEFDEAGKVIRASNDNAVIHFEYKAPVEDITSKGKPIKTKSEFSAAETEPQVANWDGDIEWEGINEVNKVEDLLRDTSDLQKYATGKKLTIKELSESMKKRKDFKNLSEDTMNQVEYIEAKHGPGPEPDDLIEGIDFASGGRVPLGHGGKGTPRRLNMKDYLKFLEKEGLAADIDPDEWFDLLKSLSAYRGYQTGGRVPLAGGGIAGMLGE